MTHSDRKPNRPSLNTPYSPDSQSGPAPALSCSIPLQSYVAILLLSVVFLQPAKSEPLCGKPYKDQIEDTISPTADKLPGWWDNNLGADHIVLPGYTPLRRVGNDIAPYGRRYRWDRSYLPSTIDSLGSELVRHMTLVAVINGKAVELKPDTITFQEDHGYSVKATASGEPLPGLKVTAETVIEYDGTGMTSVQLTPARALKLDGLYYNADIVASPAMQVISFKAGNIRRQKDRKDILTLPYAGQFLNVVGMADGNRSFWWFADNAKGWIWNSPKITEVTKSADVVRLRQHIIGKPYTLTGPLAFRLNFLATPIRDLGSEWRSKRIISSAPSDKERALGGVFKLWWTGALAHDAFPYTGYPEQVKRRIDQQDLRAYPGRKATKEVILSGKRKFGAYWIPYFSAHALSRLDPELNRYLDDWQVLPPVEFKGAASPYRHSYGKPVLTHRAKSYSNYLLSRLDQVITEIGADGIYLDHGPPFDSCSPGNGGWLDSNGILRPSLDILGLRDFLKRLHVLFYKHGKPGYIFIHASNREIIPAFAFAYAYVDGEQYRNGRARNGQYLDTVSLDEFRTRFSPDQYGLLSVWLPVDWTYHPNQPGWQGSKAQEAAYRRVQALALLNDVMDWPAGAHREERSRLIKLMDEFGIDKAEFNGYWNDDVPLRSDNQHIKISAYHRRDTGDYMFAVVNTGKPPVNTVLTLSSSLINTGRYDDHIDVDGRQAHKITPHHPVIQIAVDGRDFRILVLRSRKSPAQAN